MSLPCFTKNEQEILFRVLAHKHHLFPLGKIKGKYNVRFGKERLFLVNITVLNGLCVCVF